MDETSQKIIKATMELIRDKGYATTTTKEIAHAAGVNECTLFRKFDGKKDIVLQGIAQVEWRANISADMFEQVEWDLKKDLTMFLRAYMERMTPDFVKLSIGLRAPQIYEETAPYIQMVPQAFLTALADYLRKMEEKGKIGSMDFDAVTLNFFSAAFGYSYLTASFGKEFVGVEQEAYIQNTVAIYQKGLEKGFADS